MRYLLVFYNCILSLINYINNKHINYTLSSQKTFFNSFNSILVSSMLIDKENTSILIIILLNSIIALILTLLMLKRINIIYNTLKITNWIYTYFISFMYVMFLVGLCLSLRLVRLNHPLSIYSIKTFIYKTYYFKILQISFFVKILMIINILLIIIVIFLILRRVHKYYIVELIKLHLYYLENSRLKGPEYSFLLNKSFYACFVRDFEMKWSFIHFGYNIGVILVKIMLFLAYFYPPLKTYSLKYLDKILLIIPHLILFYFFIYDCLFNEGILKNTLLCLIFYTIFFIWVRYTYFIHQQYPQYNAILFEWYYAFPRVIYLEIMPQDLYKLDLYIKNGLYSGEEVQTMYELMDIHPIQIINRFEQISDHPFVYFNIKNSLALLKSNLYFTDRFHAKKYESAFLTDHQKKTFKNSLFLYILFFALIFSKIANNVNSKILTPEQKLMFLKGFFFYTQLIYGKQLTEKEFIKKTFQFLTTPILPNPDNVLNARIVMLNFPKYTNTRIFYHNIMEEMGVLSQKLTFTSQASLDLLPLDYMLEPYFFSLYAEKYSTYIKQVLMNPLNYSAGLSQTNFLDKLKMSSRQGNPDATFLFDSSNNKFNFWGVDFKGGNIKLFVPQATLNNIYIQNNQQLTPLISKKLNTIEYNLLFNYYIPKMLNKAKNFSSIDYFKIQLLFKELKNDLLFFNDTNLSQIDKIQVTILKLQRIYDQYEIIFMVPQITHTDITTSKKVKLDVQIDVNNYPIIPNGTFISNIVSKQIFTQQEKDLQHLFRKIEFHPRWYNDRNLTLFDRNFSFEDTSQNYSIIPTEIVLP